MVGKCYTTTKEKRQIKKQTVVSIRTLLPTFKKLFTGAKVWHKAQAIGVGRKTVYEIGPWWVKSWTTLVQVSWICHGMILAVGSVVLIGDWLGLTS